MPTGSASPAVLVTKVFELPERLPKMALRPSTRLVPVTLPKAIRLKSEMAAADAAPDEKRAHAMIKACTGR